MLHRKLSCQCLSTLLSLPYAGKGAAFVSVQKQDYKCEVFYYLALKAWYAATVIILTTTLFYKIIKDDETALPESELALSLLLEGSARCSLCFPRDIGDEPGEVSEPILPSPPPPTHYCSNRKQDLGSSITPGFHHPVYKYLLPVILNSGAAVVTNTNLMKFV